MRAKTWIKKSVLILIVLSFAFSLPCKSFASGSYVTDTKQLANCNEIVFCFWDKYTDYEEDVYSPPEYFGGFSLSEDNSLIMYITDNTAETRKQAKADCNGADIHFVVVEHSFNQLIDAKASLCRFKERLDVFSWGAYIDIPNNKVAVMLTPESNGFEREWASIVETNEDIDPLLFTFERKDPYETANYDSLIFDLEIAPASRSESSTYAFYPGMQVDYEYQFSTIGFCAYDSLGRYLLITNAHGHSFSTIYTPASVTVAGLNMSIYTLSPSPNTPSSPFDAAYIIIPAGISYTVSNNVNNSNTHISYIALDSQLSSYDGAPVSAYGRVSGFRSSTAIIYDDFGTDCLIFDTSDIGDFEHGDSGGPIYLTGNNQNRLLGTLSTLQGAGALWKNIRDRYYTLTGQTLSPYIYSY